MVPVLLAAVMVGCGEKKKSDDIIAQRVVKAAPKAPERMQGYTDKREIQWIGRTYHVDISRAAADSLPMVRDETGQKYIDNTVSVVISRSDGSVFFRHVFSKSDFSSCLDADYSQTGILEGLVFDRVDGDDLLFAASVSHPHTDEYIPLVVRLSRMGALSVNRDTELDTHADEKAQPTDR